MTDVDTTSASLAFSTSVPGPGIGAIKELDTEFVELAMLLPKQQAAKLEALANQLGMTIAQMMRKIINKTIANQ